MRFQKRFSKKVSFAIGLSLLGLTAASLLLANAITAHNWRRSFDPAAHGIPDMLGGYKVSAVLTPDNTACMRAGTKRLLLRSHSITLESSIEGAGLDTVMQELADLGLTEGVEWQISIGGPVGTGEGIEVGIARWNDAMHRNGGCIRLGGPIRLDDPSRP
jgi:hypothetical protein